jgi:hypothetical protein
VTIEPAGGEGGGQVFGSALIRRFLERPDGWMGEGVLLIYDKEPIIFRGAILFFGL